MRQLAGILHITDDFIMNIWRFRKSELDLRNNWLLGPPIHLYDIDRKTKCVGITGNNSQDCKEAEHWSFLDNYQNATKNALTETHLMFPDFLQNLTNVTKGTKRMKMKIYQNIMHFCFARRKKNSQYLGGSFLYDK